MSEWDEKKQLVKGSSDKAKLINEYLYQLRNKVFQKEIELMEKGFMLTPTLLKEAVNDHVDAVNQKTLIQVFNDFQAMRKPLIGKKIAKDTYEDNDLTGRHIKEFMEKQEKANITAGLMLEKPLMRKTEKETGRKMTISMPTMS